MGIGDLLRIIYGGLEKDLLGMGGRSYSYRPAGGLVMDPPASLVFGLPGHHLLSNRCKRLHGCRKFKGRQRLFVKAVPERSGGRANNQERRRIFRSSLAARFGSMRVAAGSAGRNRTLEPLTP
jgi:hypothetical protein